MRRMGMKNWRKGEESGGIRSQQAERRQEGSIHLSTRYNPKRAVENAAVQFQSALSLYPSQTIC
jgi:uncharacterized protein (DUF952 family)